MHPPAENRPPTGTLQPFSWAPNAKILLSDLWDIVKNAVINFQTNGETNQAAAIALYAILSFIPLFILTFLMAGHIFGSYPEIQRELMEGIRRFSPSASGNLLTQLGAIEDKQRVLGWVGIISLVWFSSMIFGAIETALNIIFRSKKPRNYFLSKALAIAMIPMAWAIGITSILITSIAALLAKQPLLVESGIPYLPLIQGATFRYVIPYVVTVIFFTIVYKIIPTVRIPLGLALVGSAIFSALMELAKHLFTWYVANYTRYNIIYGSLETVVILIFWVFYIGLILLFCAELMSSYLRRDLILLEKAFFKPGHKRRTINDRLFHKFGRMYPAGSYIFREGDHDHDMYYILSGQIRVEKRVGHIKKILSNMEAGHYFGEMAPLIDAPRTASAKAVKDSTLAVIDRSTFHNLLRESDTVSLFMLKEFSNRIKHTNQVLEETTQSWIRSMVILYLIKMWPLTAQKDPIKDLAEYTGKEPGELEEVFEDLSREGVLTFQDNEIITFHEDAAWRSLLGHRPTS
jgi:membrane protein